VSEEDHLYILWTNAAIRISGGGESMARTGYHSEDEVLCNLGYLTYC
jgi:hypothetical protein